MGCYVKGLCSLVLTTTAGSPLEKTGNDSTPQLPAQTGNGDVYWQSLPPPPSHTPPLRTLLLPDKRLSFPVLEGPRGVQGGVNCCVLDRICKLRDPSLDTGMDGGE